MEKKSKEISELIKEVKRSFEEVDKELKSELGNLRLDMSDSRSSLQELMGFEDSVKGFDLEMVTDDNIDFLDIYAEFLG